MSESAGHEALMAASLERAASLEKARYALKYESVHGGSDTLTDVQRLQRAAVLKIAEDVIRAARDREMEEAIKRWHAYRSTK